MELTDKEVRFMRDNPLQPATTEHTLDSVARNQEPTNDTTNETNNGMINDTNNGTINDMITESHPNWKTTLGNPGQSKFAETAGREYRTSANAKR